MKISALSKALPLALVVVTSACSTSLPQRDDHGQQGYYVEQSDAQNRGGVSSYAPHVCSDGGWGGRAQDCSALTKAAPAPVVRQNAPMQAPKAALNPFVGEGGKNVSIRLTVEFKTSSAELTAYEDTELNAIVATLKANPTLKIRVEGHTDDRGNPAHNQILSEKRANAVRSYLIGQGANPDQIEAKGFGAEQPIEPNTTSAGRAKNRRVMAVVVSQ